MAYEESIILSGGRLIACDSNNINQKLSFKRIKADVPAKQDYLEISCKLLITQEDFLNVIRVKNDFINEGEINSTKNLVILGTTKNKIDPLIYEQELENGNISVAFDKKTNSAKVTISISTIDNVIKTDHGGDPSKTDHSEFPWKV